MKYLIKAIPAILVLMLSYWAVRPLTTAGFFPMHDDTQVARVFEMHKSLADGMFPVRWVSDLGYGYGYPIFNFYAPLAYYVGAVFMFVGANALIATKLMIGLGVVLAGIFMYFLAKEFWGKIGGIIAAILYVYTPYHALNIYVRGAVAEIWAYAFIPLVFLAVYKIYINLNNYTDLITSQKSSIRHAQDKQINNQKLESKVKSLIWIWVCVSAVSFAAIIVSHNLTAMMVTPFLFVFAIFLYVKFRQGGKIYKPHYIVLGLLLGIILAAFYWLPALLEMKLTDVLSVVGGGSDYKDHFVCLPQLWSSPWGFGGSVRGCVDGLSFKIGKLHILFGLGSLLTLFTLFKKEKDKFQVSLLFIIFLVLSVFLTLELSKFIWDLIPHMAFFQFPWRFLIPVSFFLSFLGGSVFWFLENINFSKKFSGYFYWLICAAAVIAIIFLNNSLFAPQKIIDAKSDDYTNKTVLNWKVSKISDEYMPKGFFKPLRPIDVPRNIVETSKKNFKILSLNKKTQQISFIVDEGSETTIYINIAYFPGWHVFVDGKQVWFKYSGQGLFFDLSKGKHEIYLKFIQTPVEKAGNVISIAGVIMLIAGIISHRKSIFYD